MNEVGPIFFLGCDECSETIKVITGDVVAVMLTEMQAENVERRGGLQALPCRDLLACRGCSRRVSLMRICVGLNEVELLLGQFHLAVAAGVENCLRLMVWAELEQFTAEQLGSNLPVWIFLDVPCL